MERNNHSYNGNGISRNSKGCLDIAKLSQEVPLPKDNLGRRKTMVHLVGSCVMIQVSDRDYLVGALNWTNPLGYSLTVNGEERQLPYSGIVKLFEPSEPKNSHPSDSC